MNERSGDRRRLRRPPGARPAPDLEAAIDEVVALLQRLAASHRALGRPEATPGRGSRSWSPLVRRFLLSHLARVPARDLAFALGLAWAISPLERSEEILDQEERIAAVCPRLGAALPEHAGWHHQAAQLWLELRDTLIHDRADPARRVESGARDLESAAAAARERIASSAADARTAARAAGEARRLGDIFQSIAVVASVQGRALVPPPRPPATARPC
ncbi:MAG TPA: hypothetical protein VMV46_19525 [Thermoanaerobaculia bacterium]|nr:hypothetical protein [Thermoanaerobaculia bacterium]